MANTQTVCAAVEAERKRCAQLARVRLAPDVERAILDGSDPATAFGQEHEAPDRAVMTCPHCGTVDPPGFGHRCRNVTGTKACDPDPEPSQGQPSRVDVARASFEKLTEPKCSTCGGPIKWLRREMMFPPQATFLCAECYEKECLDETQIRRIRELIREEFAAHAGVIADTLARVAGTAVDHLVHGTTRRER